MKSRWGIESGQIALRWFDIGQPNDYKARWMEESSAAEGSYLTPIPDFASHSPFGGAYWFQARCGRSE
jgi:hypothetical protein